MRHALLMALLAGSAALTAQAQVTLRIQVALTGAGQGLAPVPRHVLLVSDNPATAPPRRLITGADGTVEIRLRPGTYIVESDQPVVVSGRAYQWTEVVEVRAGRDVTLRLTAANAEVSTASPGPAGAGPSASGAGATSLLMQWQDGVAAIWSPTSRASAFLADAAGLLLTSGAAVGDVPEVSVQVEAEALAPGRVLFADRTTGAAAVWVSPSVVSGRPVLPLVCPPTKAASLDERQEVAAIAWALRRPTDVTWGEVTGLTPRAVQTDMRVGFGGVGGPVFSDEATLVGMTVPATGDESRPGDVDVLRATMLCDALSSARSTMAGREPPPATSMPVEPPRPFPDEARASADTRPATTVAPPSVATSDFDIAFLTPPVIDAARQRGDRTGRTGARDQEAEMRLGLITDFGAWSEYFIDRPAVLAVRVTPKLVEGFWKRLARGAALTQGAVLPAFKDFKTDFARLQVRCGDAEVAPIHPFVLEHRVSGRDVVREGLYVFGPDAFGPHCAGVTLTLYSGRAPARGEAITVPAAIVDRLWQDFAPWRAGR